MNDPGSTPIQNILESLYRTESRAILSTLIRLLGDFDLAEDALHEAFQAALEKWPVTGLPENPRAWLISAGRFKGIDRFRRSRRFVSPLENLPAEPTVADDPPDTDEAHLPDDRLKLIFTCCHPALTPEARSALTLREVCGLTTEEIARAFLSTPPAIAQRIVRAKNKIREARIPYEVPPPAELSQRLETVLQVIYLVFNEGYSASAGDSLTRPDFSGEAIRLTRLLYKLLPETEVGGLLGLMLLQESRRETRASPTGELILLEQQDRSLWNRELIQEGKQLVEKAFTSGRIGPYTLQAAIASAHAESVSSDRTDWTRITALYDLLAQIDPSPVVELNRAVAIAMRDGPSAGLPLVDAILDRGDLTDYHLVYSVRADLLRRLGKKPEARTAYQQALSRTQQEPERRFLERRLLELD